MHKNIQLRDSEKKTNEINKYSTETKINIKTQCRVQCKLEYKKLYAPN